ncbi:MAG: DUF2341 domain-containing protein [Candidatus Nanohaloarchaeota archaeon QJJ-9]|nr:DUF2341 domain-containing protein [Candidatus Nanohaloarchaeota archaeon QJJ-9]
MNTKVLIVAVISAFLLPNIASAYDTWFDTSWQYRKPVNITENSGEDLKNYQVRLKFDTSSLISSGKMESNCSDIRLVDSEGKKLDYWIESGCNTSSTKVWVNVNLSAASSRTFYIYYGNPEATSTGSASDVFIVYDDFNDGDLNNPEWGVDNNDDCAGSVSVSNGALNLHRGGCSGNGGSMSVYQDLLTNIGDTRFLVDVKVDSHGLECGGYGGCCEFPASVGLGYSTSGIRHAWCHGSASSSGNTHYHSDISSHGSWYTLEYNTVDWSGGDGNLSRVTLRSNGWNFDAHYDNFKLTRYTSPEPSYNIDEEQKLKSAPKIVSTKPKDGKETRNETVSFSYTPKCFTPGGCEKAELWFNRTENITYTWKKDVKTEWWEGTLKNTGTAGKDRLGLEKNVIGESGVVSLSSTIDSTIDGGVIKTVDLKYTYQNPVVVAYIATRNGGESVDVRVKNVTNSSFKIFTEEPDNQVHSKESVGWLVVEEGTHKITDGTKVEAGIHTTSNVHREGNSFNGDYVKFNQNFSSQPALFHTLNTYKNTAFMSTVSPKVNSTGFKIQQEAGGSGSSASTEDIGWIAFENIGGSSTVNNYKYTVKTHGKDGDGDGVEDSSETFSYSYSTNPAVLIDGYTGAGQDGYWTRGAGTYSSSSASYYAEEDSTDGERGHTDEGFSLLALEPGAELIESQKYKNSGNYTSEVYNPGEKVLWNSSTINSSTPNGTDYNITYAENSTGTWRYHESFPEGIYTQYMKYNLSLEGNGTETPEIYQINLTYVREEKTWRKRKVNQSPVENNTENTISYTFQEKKVPATFNWTIKLRQPDGQQSKTENRTLKVLKPDPPPIVTEPEPNNTSVDTEVTLSAKVVDHNSSKIDTWFFNGTTETAIGQKLGVTNNTFSNYLLQSLKPNKSYRWYIKASDGNTNTTSNTFTFSTGLEINLTYRDRSETESGFKVYSNASGSWKKVHTFPTPDRSGKGKYYSQTFIDETLTEKKHTCYKISSYNQWGESGKSGKACID